MKVALHSPNPDTERELRQVIVGLGHECASARSIVDAARSGAGIIFAEWALSSSASDFFAGLDLASACSPPVPIVVLLSSRSLELGERARKAGAADVLFLPPDPVELKAEIEAAGSRTRSAYGERTGQYNELRTTMLVGEHPRFTKCLDELALAANSSLNILLLGETGVGKEMFAQAIHALSPRAGHRCLAINCATLDGNLLASELFGHTKGAFTGADKARVGRFEEVGEGTLFLDEIGEMKPELQATLLRAIDQREFHRLGDNASLPFRGRLICATRLDVDGAVTQGRFRDDLLARISQRRILLPPLRERRSDITLLAKSLLYKHAGARIEVSESTKQQLNSYDYPGNVRQLENIMRYALERASDRNVILPRDLPEEVFQNNQPAARPDTLSISISAATEYEEARTEALRAVDRIFLTRAMEEHRGNQSAAAAALGIDRKTFAMRYQQTDSRRSAR